MKKIVILILFLTVFSGLLHCEKVGKVFSISGEKKLFKSLTESGKGILITKDTEVNFGDYLITGKNTRAVIHMIFNKMDTEIILREKAKIKIVKKVNIVKSSGIKLLAGRLWSLFKGKKKNGYAVETHNSVAGVEGTEFEIFMEDSKTVLFVFSGIVKLFAKRTKKNALPFPLLNIKSVEKGNIAIVLPSRKIEIIDKNSGDSFLKYSEEFKKSQKFYQNIKTTEKTEVEEEVNDNLETYGNCSVRIGIKGFDLPVHLAINGCSSLNDEFLEFNRGKPLILNNLEKDTEYTLTFTCTGISNKIVFKPEEYSSKMLVVGFRKFYIGVKTDSDNPLFKKNVILTTGGNLPQNIINDHVKIFIDNKEIQIVLKHGERKAFDALVSSNGIFNLAMPDFVEGCKVLLRDDKGNEAEKKLSFPEDFGDHDLKIITKENDN